MARMNVARRVFAATMGLNRQDLNGASAERRTVRTEYGIVRRCVAAILSITLPGQALSNAPLGQGRRSSLKDSKKPAVAGAWRSPVTSLARRNLIAAGAGALLAGILGTVVTVGATSSSRPGPYDPSNQALGQTGARKSDYKWVTESGRFSFYVPRTFERDVDAKYPTYIGKSSGRELEVRAVAGEGQNPLGEIESTEKVASKEPGYRMIRLERIGARPDDPAELEYYFENASAGVRRVIVRAVRGPDGKIYTILLRGPTFSWSDSYQNFSVAAWSLCVSGYECAADNGN